jgi:hypothetical protein
MLSMSDYLQLLNRELPKPKLPKDAPIALDLFAGCGGLALGFEAAGFQTVGYEMLQDACDSYSTNLHGSCHCTKLTEYTQFEHIPDIIVGGPPCQPFSVGGRFHFSISTKTKSRFGKLPHLLFRKYWRQESNLHGSPHWSLNPARLPVPPLQLFW